MTETRTVIASYTYEGLNAEPNMIDLMRQPLLNTLTEESTGHENSWPKSCPRCMQTDSFLIHRVEVIDGECLDGNFQVHDLRTVYKPHWIACRKCGREGRLDEFTRPTSQKTPETETCCSNFIVTFVETDGNRFDGVNAKVMAGRDPESVARARVAEVAADYKEEYSKGGDVWEESQPGRYLENEEEIVKIISGWHGYYQVFVFKPNGESIDIDLDRDRFETGGIGK